jgi:PAS domain S-box-containing protein
VAGTEAQNEQAALFGELRRERDFSSTILDVAGALVVVLDPQGRIVRFNRCCEQTTGYTFREVQGRPFWDLFIVPEELDAVRGEFGRLRGGDFPSQLENYWLTRDGSKRRIAWSNTALTDAAGAVEYVIGTGLDITEQRRAKEALRESEALSRSIIDSSRDCIKILDLDGRLKFMSEGGIRLLGIHDLARYLDLPYETFWQGSDREATLEAIARARAGEIGRFQGYCPTEDGIPKWWDVVISPILGPAGEIERLLAVSRDVTEQRAAEQALRASEEKLRALFELLPIGISILDADRRVVRDNPALERILSLPKEGLEAGVHRSRAYLRSDGTPMPPGEFPSARAMRENSPAQDQVGVVREDGTVVWTEVSAVPVSLDDWKVVIATTDITLRRQAEQALLRANEELERRVEKRTAELLDMNQLLQFEISERLLIEEDLRRSEERLEQRVGERTRELTTLLEISNAVALSQGLEPLLGQILDLLQEVVPYDGATVYRLEGDVLKALLHRGPLPLEEVQRLHLPVDRLSLAHELLSAKRPISIPDLRAESPPARAVRQVLGERVDSLFGYVHSWLGVPLAVKGAVVGLMTLQWSAPRGLDEREMSLAQAFAGQLAVAVENARLHQQAQELAALKERQNLARELHDAVSQTLFSASLAAEVVPRLWEKDREIGLQSLDEVRQLTRGALAEMRTLLLELRPSALVQTELAALLHQLAEAASSRARIPVEVQADPHCPLPADVQVALYRIAQEALNNVAKHAGAHQVVVGLHCVPLASAGGGEDTATGVELSVADDGCGFDAAAPHHGGKGLGLGIIRERAEAVGAALEISSEVGLGTRVTVTWPANDR